MKPRVGVVIKYLMLDSRLATLLLAASVMIGRFFGCQAERRSKISLTLLCELAGGFSRTAGIEQIIRAHTTLTFLMSVRIQM